MTNKKKCFVISSISEPNSEIRIWADNIFNYIITPVVCRYGYSSLRADHIEKPGVITNQIIKELIESELVIADLTWNNPNVYYELAIRHVSRRPFIQVIRDGDKIPFDVASERTVFIDIGDLGKAEKSKEVISKQIETIEENSELIDTPISMALSLSRSYEIDNITKHRLDQDKQYKHFFDQNDLYNNIKTTINSLLECETLQDELMQYYENNSQIKIRQSIKEKMRDVSLKVIENIQKNHFITIDTRPLLGEKGYLFHYTSASFVTFSDLLDLIWTTIAAVIPPYTYGKIWVLNNKNTNIQYNKTDYGSAYDNRSLEEVGIKPGSYLEVVPMR